MLSATNHLVTASPTPLFNHPYASTHDFRVFHTAYIYNLLQSILCFTQNVYIIFFRGFCISHGMCTYSSSTWKNIIGLFVSCLLFISVSDTFMLRYTQSWIAVVMDSSQRYIASQKIRVTS